MPVLTVDKFGEGSEPPPEELAFPLQMMMDGYILAAPTGYEALVLMTDGWIWGN